MFRLSGILITVIFILAACASPSPAMRFVSDVKTAQQDNQPLLVYMLYPTYPTGDNGPGPYARIGYIITAEKPIAKFAFTLTAYNRGHPVLSSKDSPLAKELTAMGPFAPGSSHDMLTKAPVWSQRTTNISCVRLTGLVVDYQDGSSITVPASDMGHYLVPQINKFCVFPFIGVPY